jgi:hypothetical protein
MPTDLQEVYNSSLDYNFVDRGQVLTADVWVQSQFVPYGVYGRQSGTGTAFFSMYICVPLCAIITPVFHIYIHSSASTAW